MYGTIPTKFNTNINKNNENKNGKYLNPALPILSFTTLTIFSYNISITDCHLPGTKFFILLFINPLSINKAITK